MRNVWRHTIDLIDRNAIGVHEKSKSRHKRASRDPYFSWLSFSFSRHMPFLKNFVHTAGLSRLRDIFGFHFPSPLFVCSMHLWPLWSNFCRRHSAFRFIFSARYRASLLLCVSPSIPPSFTPLFKATAAPPGSAKKALLI